MFATAISDWLRTGMAGLGRKAGDAYLADQRRRIAGKAAHGSGPGRNRDAVLEAHEAEPKASNYRIAQMTGIPEASLSGILCARHSMTNRSMYANQQEDDEGGDGRGGGDAVDPEGAH
jgi:hypothetical protein